MHAVIMNGTGKSRLKRIVAAGIQLVQTGRSRPSGTLGL